MTDLKSDTPLDSGLTDNTQVFGALSEQALTPKPMLLSAIYSYILATLTANKSSVRDALESETRGEIGGDRLEAGSSYQIQITDKGRRVRMASSSGNTVTVPSNTTVDFPIGSRIEVVQWGGGQTTIVPASSVTIRSSNGRTKMHNQYSSALLDKVDTNEWLLVGDLV